MQLLDEGDRAFGPARTAIETAAGHLGGAAVGSEVMRRLVWRLTLERSEEARARTIELVTEQLAQIERLAKVLLESKQVLHGDEIVAVLGGGG